MATLSISFTSTSTINAYEGMSGLVSGFGVNFIGPSVAGYAVSLADVQLGTNSFMADESGRGYPVYSSTMNLVFSPGSKGNGTVIGTFSVSSSLATLSGTLLGGCDFLPAQGTP